MPRCHRNRRHLIGVARLADKKGIDHVVQHDDQHAQHSRYGHLRNRLGDGGITEYRIVIISHYITSCNYINVVSYISA